MDSDIGDQLVTVLLYDRFGNEEHAPFPLEVHTWLIPDSLRRAGLDVVSLATNLEGVPRTPYSPLHIVASLYREVGTWPQSLTWISSGSYHVIIFARTDHAEIVIRISKEADFDLALRKLLCEAALLAYLATKTSIPVPAVLFTSVEKTTEMPAPYMFMSKCAGTRLDYVWGNLTMAAQASIVQQLASYTCQLLELGSDTQIGSMSSWNQDGVTTTAPLWTHTRPAPLPFNSVEELILSCLECSSTDEDAVGSSEEGQAATSATVELTKTNPSVWRSEQQVVGAKWSVPVHQDLEQRNILVEEVQGESGAWRVTCLLDWEFAWMLPRSMTAQYPVFIQYDGKYDPPHNVPNMKVERFWEASPTAAPHLREVYQSTLREPNPECYSVLKRNRVTKQLLDFVGTALPHPGLRSLRHWFDAELGVGA